MIPKQYRQLLLAVSLVACLVAWLGIFAQAQTTGEPIAIETGVSAKLAAYRKKTISRLHYDLHFTLPQSKQQPIAATETIQFSLNQNDRPLQLDFKEKKDHLHAVTVNGRQVSALLKNEHLIIAPAYLRTGINSIGIRFTAGDLSLNRNDDYLYTLLVPDRARTVFPCFDQPDLKATFALTLTLPNNWNALCNAPLADSTVQAAHKTYRYGTSDTISTYLFSFAAGKFDRITKTVNGRTMNFYHRETDSSKLKQSVDTVFRLHSEAISFLENYTGIAFPFQKLDFIAIPDFQYGGMEHVGAIQYKASALFLDSGATRDEKNSRANLIAHETSHMWFGDLVTMQWFNDVWMKEVFANFVADKITGGKEPLTYELKFLIDHYPAAYAVDRTAGANPIRQPLANLQEAGTLYGNIIYHKAPVMMRQLERLMGKDTFRDGLREYLKTYAYNNATWTNLITILDKRTPADLAAWNKVWVNEPGRPQLGYELLQTNGVITSLQINQKEDTTTSVLPQYFDLAFVYEDTVLEIPLYMKGASLQLEAAAGKKVPQLLLFNASGQGYGVFPADTNLLPQLPRLHSPVVRASAYINLYENMLNGNAVAPQQLLQLYEAILPSEEEELNLRLLTGYVNDIFWRLVRPSLRDSLAPALEQMLWQNMMTQTAPNKKKILFKTYQSIATSGKAKDNLFRVWQSQSAPEGVILTEEDYTSLALSLALKDYEADSLLQQQYNRIKNKDRKQRLLFLMPALSADSLVRDAFFASLSKEENREKEAWVTTALSYLHHPLRAAASQKYLPQSLALLPEIQMTGDIFFPAAWLQSTFGMYQSHEAADAVRRFLQQHPGFNSKLKAKILQAADPLFRAEKLLDN